MNLAAALSHHPSERIAVIRPDRSFTYGDLVAGASSGARALAAAGAGPGDRVAVCAHDAYEMLCGVFGVWTAGAVAVPLNPGAPEAELRREIAVVGARWLFGDDRNVGIRCIREDDAEGLTPPVAEKAPDDPALAMFTSGVAGAPRAAVLTHGGIAANLAQVRAHSGGAAAVATTDTVFCALPLFHVLGLATVAVTTLHAGARLVLFDRFDPVVAAAAVEDHGVTVLPGAPAMWSALVKAPIGRSSFRSVRLAGSGAAHLPVGVADAVRERFGLTIYEGYGLTEMSPVVTLAAGTAAPTGSIGRPLPGIEVRLVDDAGDDVLVGDDGELWTRGPNLFAGYLDDPEATRRAVDGDGWLHTGDVATVDADGYLYIVDRRKDLIIVSGFNVFPAEVEDVITSLPGVGEVAVVGEPDPDTGEAVHAHVVASDPAVTAEAVEAHCARLLAPYKCPTSVSFVTSLPKTATGKVKRALLR